MYNTKAWWPWATTLLVAFIGCSSDSETSGSVGGDSVKERTAAKPSEAAAFTPTTETRRILGFEDAASSDWTSDAGTLSRSATFAEGKSALSLQLTRPRGEVCSSKVSLPWKERAAVGFQLLMQEPAPASGDVRVVLRPAAPNSEPIELAPFALDDKQPGVFHQVISPLQTEGRTLDDKSQVQLCIAIDAAPGRYVLDDLRFLDTAPDETSVSDATHRLGSAPISRVGAPVGSVYGDWPGLSVSPNLTSSTGEPMQGDGVLAEPSADDTPLWSDPDAAVGKGPSDAGPPRVAMFELDDPDFCTTETLLNTAPFVSGISPLPNGTTIPYPLCTAQQYAHVIATSTLWSSNFVLMADIDLGTLSPPPTTNSVALSGVFEGNGKTLSNYTITTSGKAGVLGRLGQNGVIRNLVLSDFNVSGIARVGALVHESSGLIEHVTGVNLNVTGDESENYGVGGLVGLNYGTIADVTASVSVVAGPNAHSVGGLVGRQGNNSLNF